MEPALRDLGRGLGRAAAERGAPLPQAMRALGRSLPPLLADSPHWIEPLRRLLEQPACADLLVSADAGRRRRCRAALLRAQPGAMTPERLAGLSAFLDGLESGYREPRIAMAQHPTRSAGPAWVAAAFATLMAAAAGVIGYAGFRWLRQPSPALTPVLLPPALHSLSEPPPSAPPAGTGSTALGPSAAALASAEPPGRRCAALADPADALQAPAAPSNYGRRLRRDAEGHPIHAQPALIVLHETVMDLRSTIDLFQRDHAQDAVQVSYHVLIGRDGRRVRVVPDADRAFGAGDSAFGAFTLRTSAAHPPSINNVALHVSLESPPDGRGDQAQHSGYTQAQYSSLAQQVIRWQVDHGIRADRITTHARVDRSRSRKDPRSFNWSRFGAVYRQWLRRCR